MSAAGRSPVGPVPYAVGVTFTDRLAIFAAGAGAGAGMINAVAGGGTLLSFPVLVGLGRDPIVANATNALALWPAAVASALGFRRELAKGPRLLKLTLPPAVAGAVLGAWLLLVTPSRTFSAIVPWPVLAATLLLALQRPLHKLTGARELPEGDVHDGRRAVGLVVGQLLVSIYGGYFGAGDGDPDAGGAGPLRPGRHPSAQRPQERGRRRHHGVAGIYFAARGPSTGATSPCSPAARSWAATPARRWGASSAAPSPRGSSSRSVWA